MSLISTNVTCWLLVDVKLIVISESKKNPDSRHGQSDKAQNKKMHMVNRSVSQAIAPLTHFYPHSMGFVPPYYLHGAALVAFFKHSTILICLHESFLM